MIPRKMQWIAAGAIVFFLWAWLYHRAHNERIRREAVAKAEVTRLDVERARVDTVNVLLRDSLRIAKARTDTVLVTATVATKSYERERNKVDIAAPQPAGVPEGYVVVPVSYVQSADSLVTVVSSLTAALNSERAVSARRIDALMQSDSLSRAINAQLQIQIKAIKPHASDKMKWFLFGGGVALGAVAVFKN